MKRVSALPATAMAIVMFSIAFLPQVSAETTPDEWTVMFYMDGDNNVESYALKDLEELKLVGSSTTVNYVVLLDTLSGPANLLYVNKGGTTLLEAWGEVPMDSPATLTRFIDSAEARYPAYRYALVLWDHGGGWSGLCWDDTSGSNMCLTLPELRTGIADAGVVFDAVVFNACVMATAEVAYQLDGYADFAVFSQENMYALGFPYDAVAGALNAAPLMTARELVLMMTDEYAQYYTSLGYSGVTISVWDMSYMDQLKSAVSVFASEQLSVFSTYYRSYKSARLSTEDPNNAADIVGYASNVYSAVSDTGIRLAAAEVVSVVEQGIIFEWHSPDVTDENGLGIYFPTGMSKNLWLSYYKPKYSTIPFATETGWINFINAYVTKSI